mmetsp:Transcript_11918/g.34401  ORF Transcript_11918/g.34401 Transcript_11918/m.34401 type:complete len:222 (-) Transcript_11918:1531-2196(-)
MKKLSRPVAMKELTTTTYRSSSSMFSGFHCLMLSSPSLSSSSPLLCDCIGSSLLELISTFMRRLPTGALMLTSYRKPAAYGYAPSNSSVPLSSNVVTPAKPCSRTVTIWGPVNSNATSRFSNGHTLSASPTVKLPSWMSSRIAPELMMQKSALGVSLRSAFATTLPTPPPWGNVSFAEQAIPAPAPGLRSKQIVLGTIAMTSKIDRLSAVISSSSLSFDPS